MQPEWFHIYLPIKSLVVTTLVSLTIDMLPGAKNLVQRCVWVNINPYYTARLLTWTLSPWPR